MDKKHVLFTYSINELEKSKRVRFVYLLKGRRGDKGIIEELNGKFLAPGCFIIPIIHDNEMTSVFKKWGVKPKKIKINIYG